MQIAIYPLPSLVPSTLSPDAAVFIDVLRATSTMTVALNHGVQKIIPVADPQEALRLKERLIASGPLAADHFLTGGERKAVKIDGFDLSNSPKEYAAEKVNGKTLLFSTTNGTRAILSLKSGRTKKYLGSFLAAEALVLHLSQDSTLDTLAMICAGTDGSYTEEDLLLAGYLTDELVRRKNNSLACSLSTVAQTYRYLWRETKRKIEANQTSLVAELRASRGGQNLTRVHLTEDIRDVARLNSIDLVAEYRMGEIRAFSPDRMSR